MAKAQSAASTEVAVAAKTAVSVASFMEDDFGTGFEGADSDSYAIPFLQILQKMSPSVDEDNGAYVEGAKAGMLMNSVTQALYDVKDRPLQIVPCAFKRTFILWAPRDAGGGFLGEKTPEEMDDIIASGEVENVNGRYLVKDEDGKVDDKKSNYYMDTRSHYVIVLDPKTGEYGPAILSLSSTQIKASRGLMTTLQQRKAESNGVRRTLPTFANIVNITTKAMANEKGSWSAINFEVQKELISDPALYSEAKEFYRAVSAGEKKADHSKSVDASAGEASSKPQDADGF